MERFQSGSWTQRSPQIKPVVTLGHVEGKAGRIVGTAGAWPEAGRRALEREETTFKGSQIAVPSRPSQ